MHGVVGYKEPVVEVIEGVDDDFVERLVFEVLSEMKRPMTAKEILLRLREQGWRISYTRLIRIIRMMVENGKINVEKINQKQWCFWV